MTIHTDQANQRPASLIVRIEVEIEEISPGRDYQIHIQPKTSEATLLGMITVK